MRESMLGVEEILEATAEVLRRHGPAKASVVDVARALGVSHGTVYRHFPSKVALREAVIRRWIDRTHDGHVGAADDASLPSPDRLRHWLSAVFHAKRATALKDPELFDTFCVLVTEQSEVVEDHIADLIAQIRIIVAEGARQGHFRAGDPDIVARAVFDATARFHHPAHAHEWHSPRVDQDFDAVCSLMLNGLVLE